MINKYEVINPVIDYNKPYLNKRNELVIPCIKDYGYKWYLEVARNNSIDEREYYLLFSNIEFDKSCVKLTKDYNKRYAILPRGEFADFVYSELQNRANLEMDFYQNEMIYDSWRIR